MIRSMTGFASKIVTISLPDASKVNLAISLKSLNSRYFEATCKLHYQLTNLETDLIKILKNQLLRGHIYLTMHMNNQNLFKGSVAPSLAMVEGYVQAIHEIQKKFNLQGELSVADLFHLPNVFTIEEKDLDDATKKLIIATVQEMIGEVIAMEEKEGATLKGDIEQRVASMQQDIMRIEQASAELMKTQKEKVTNTIKELETDASKLAEFQKNAAYIMLDKMDIHEEIIRFNSHLKNLVHTLSSTDVEKGKRLDFILQELSREINTIAAKCSDATIGSLAIEVKVELEKAREQTQNIV